MFVERNARGQIVAAYTSQQFGTQESVPNDDPHLVKYMSRDGLSAALLSIGISVDDIAVLATRAGAYVERGPHEEIVSASPVPTRSFQERLDEDAPSLMAFRNREPVEVEPEGYHFQFNGGKWRILRLEDRVVTHQGLPNREACVAAMRERAQWKARFDGDAAAIASPHARDFQEQERPEPDGFRYLRAADGWRVTSVSDGAVLVQGLPDREACVAFMGARADRRKQEDAARRAKWVADREAGWDA